MKAVVIKNESLFYEEVGEIYPKENEVKIKVAFAGVNRADILQKQGSYPPPPGCPNWPGLEVSGQVVQVGENTTAFKVGDRVCALLGGGGYAQYVCVDENMVMHLPSEISLEQGAAIVEACATGYLNLFEVGEAKKGETLLFTGGNSGLASLVIPMAKSIGMRVITTVRGEDKKKAVEYLGCDLVVDTKVESLASALKEQEEKGTPVNLAIDCLGSQMMGDSLKYVARGCRWITIATLAGDNVTVDFKNVYVKNIRLIGSTLRSQPVERKGKIIKQVESVVLPLVIKGDIVPKIDAIIDIENANDAHALLEQSKAVGKIVLKVN